MSDYILLPSLVPVGDVAWRLYDTYRFPVDLTHLMVEEKGIEIDCEAYEAAKKEAQVSVSLISTDYFLYQLITSDSTLKAFSLKKICNLKQLNQFGFERRNHHHVLRSANCSEHIS